MLGLGVQEMLFIFAAALLLFGPRKLPEIGRTLGKGLAEFRRASAELKRSLDAEMIEEELREGKRALESVNPRRYLEEATASLDPKRVAREAVRAPASAGTSSPAGGDAGAPPPSAEEPPVSEGAAVRADEQAREPSSVPDGTGA